MPAKLRVVKSPTKLALERLVDDYLMSCRARNLSPKTLHGYEVTLRKVFLPWCARESIDGLPQLSQKRLDALSAELLSRGLSPYSAASYVRVVNQLLAYAKRDGQRVEALAQVPNTPRKHPVILTREEITALEGAARTERDRLIIRLLADTGMRVGEVCKLKPSDLVEFDRAYYLHVRGKGARDRKVPIPRLAPRLKRYIERTRPRDVVSERLFIGLRRRPRGDFEPLTESGIAQMLSATAKQAAMQKRVYPHLLRHSFATFAINRGTNPIQLAQILGHSSLAMITNVYSHLAPRDASGAMARLLSEE